MQTSAPLIYSGSVKNIYRRKPGILEFEFSDAYSVFDWGRMPDAFPEKGKYLATMAAFFFEKLSDIGVQNHFLCFMEPNSIEVKEMNVIPLEVIFRFGMPEGSSLKDRLSEEYMAELGLNPHQIPKSGAWLAKPIVEFFTKRESVDRPLTMAEAEKISGLSKEKLLDLKKATLKVAQWLKDFFAKRNLELWDGKFEWAEKNNQWVLVDSIGPDELRLLSPNSKTQISKEFLRIHYRKTSWFKEMIEIKKSSSSQELKDGSWKENVRKKIGEPPALPSKTKQTATQLYSVLCQSIVGEPDFKSLKNLVQQIEECSAN